MHHLSTRARRVAALRALLDVLRPEHGRTLVFVWAVEQAETSRRAALLRDGGSEGEDSQGRDLLVPWVLKESRRVGRGGDAGRGRNASSAAGNAHLRQPSQIATEEKQHSQTFLRYYHFYAQGELEADITAAGGACVRAGMIAITGGQSPRLRASVELPFACACTDRK